MIGKPSQNTLCVVFFSQLHLLVPEAIKPLELYLIGKGKLWLSGVFSCQENAPLLKI